MGAVKKINEERSKRMKASLEFDGNNIELEVFEGTEGEKSVDITKLRGETGLVTLDSGYGNTGACTSGITFLNGEKGILKYRGYPIEQLAEHSNFEEVSYLLIHGNLPSEKQLNEFLSKTKERSEIPEKIREMLKLYPKTAHPMAVLSATTASLSAFYPELNKQDLSTEEQNEAIYNLLGQLKTMTSSFYRVTQNEDFVAPKFDSWSADFLNMMFEGSGKNIDDEVIKALDTLFILHADHEQNCSTSTVRMVGSSKANLFATISAGIDALWGPLHGGANQAVIEMLDAIKEDGGDHKRYLEKAKDKNDPFRLMGFGHRVYKNFDPRAKIIKKACDTVLDKLGVEDPVLDIAKGLEEEALKDPYFVDRKLYPNVDFYSGIIYRALGIPVDFFTPMFVLGRLPGWIAQWKEMVEDPKMRICRPRQIYTGETNREYIDLKKR